MLRNKDGKFMDHQELYKVLGIKGERLPPEGFAPVEVNGVMFFCEPANGLYDHMQDRKVKSPHRIKYLCQYCGAWIPFGRAWQHNRGKEHKLNVEVGEGRP